VNREIHQLREKENRGLELFAYFAWFAVQVIDFPIQFVPADWDSVNPVNPVLCVSASLRFFRSLNRGLNCQRGKIPCSALSPSVFDARTSHRDLKRHGD